MDVLGVHHDHQMKTKKKHSTKRLCKKDIKVVYISSPMKVKTCASNFRALVQELTGKDSDADASASRFIDAENSSPKLVDDDQDAVGNDHLSVLTESESSPTVSGSEMDVFDDVFMAHREGSFLGMFSSNLFNESYDYQFNHAIRSFGSV